MKICFPTMDSEGISGQLHDHFGSADFFFIYDTESGESELFNNQNREHAHGECSPKSALASQDVKIVIVRGIGKRAIDGLNSLGIKVYQAKHPSIKDNIEAFKVNSLSEMNPEFSCKGHGGACSH